VQITHGRRCWRDRIGVARFKRRLHQLADGTAWIPEALGEVRTSGDGFIIDRLPAPAFVRRRMRARRCRKAPGRTPSGCRAAQREKFFGWRVRVACRPDGGPVRVPMPPAGVHDLPPVHELASGLPAGARLLGVTACNGE
jgi:hypothetical protein